MNDFFDKQPPAPPERHIAAGLMHSLRYSG
jgi:hypothetical protein